MRLDCGHVVAGWWAKRAAVCADDGKVEGDGAGGGAGDELSGRRGV